LPGVDLHEGCSSPGLGTGLQEDSTRRFYYLVAVVLFIVSFVLFRRRQIATGISAFATEKSTICNQCHEPSLAKEGSECPCGGTLEPLEHWEWIDSQSHDKPERSPNPHSETG